MTAPQGVDTGTGLRTAWDVVGAFERAVAEYTGAPEAVAVDSATNGLFLALRWRWKRDGPIPARRVAEIPRRTYVSVPMQVLHAGYRVLWRDEAWEGMYELAPLNVWDAAKRFTEGMYARDFARMTPPLRRGALVVVSFQAWKILGIGRGGAILTDDPAFAAWARKARHDGRTPGVPTEAEAITELGWHMSLTPPEAALGLWKLAGLPRDNPDLPNDHEDCSRHPVFRAWS